MPVKKLFSRCAIDVVLVVYFSSVFIVPGLSSTWLPDYLSMGPQGRFSQTLICYVSEDASFKEELQGLVL